MDVFQINWIYCPEYFPTYIRSSAVGILDATGKVGAMTGSFLSEYLDNFSIRYSLYAYTSVVVLACVACVFLDKETKGEKLIDSRNKNTRTYGALDQEDKEDT